MEIVDYLLARKKAGGSDVTIEQLSVTENGTYSEQGIAYSPVVVDVPAPENSYQLKDVPSGTISTIEDGTDLPMSSLKVGIEPVQDLHGYDHPWAGGAGKNLYGGSALKTSLLTITGATEGSDGNGDFANIPRSTALNDIILFDGFEENQQYTIIFKILPTGSAPSNIRIYYSDDTYYTITASADETLTTVTYTTTAQKTVSAIKLGYWYLSTCKIYYENCGVFVGANQTFEPYSNICPISGWTAANVNVSPTTSAEDGTTYTIEFKDGDNPLTVYGGTLNAISGLLTVTDAYIASYNGETLPSTWISDRDVYAAGTTPTTGAEVVYKLANSVTYHLTPTQVRTLVGNNNIWADTGNIIEGKYFKEL